MKIKYILFSTVLLIIFACQQKSMSPEFEWPVYDESQWLLTSEKHDNPRMHYKRIQSEFLDRPAILEGIMNQIEDFSAEDYESLKGLILDKNIRDIQAAIDEKKLNYETLTKWYLYRIATIETDSFLSLNTIISINPMAVEEARKFDKGPRGKHPIYGMPVLLKDNINTKDMPTTAGAYVLKDNYTEDAELVKNLKNNGAIILAKVNLSEWAYYFCAGCPVGYSAVGGQTLNPYGRMIFETGGSSSGSATAVAANFGVAAVGTETSGSILSPSSQNSIVGLKPTVGLVSGLGIVPISKTLDTAGPMTRSVEDNLILLTAMADQNHEKLELPEDWNQWKTKNLGENFSIGVFRDYLENDSLYAAASDLLSKLGIETVEVNSPVFDYAGFLSLLNIDMKFALPQYLESHAGPEVEVRNLKDIMEYNSKDSLSFMPYNQGRFDGIIADTTDQVAFEKIKEDLMMRGKSYFENLMSENGIDIIASINNYHAGQAAVARYPAITVPMGYREDGEPAGITFIAPSGNEMLLYNIAAKFELLSQLRKCPPNYN
jgi:amidase